MTRRFTVVTVVLTAAVAFLLGLAASAPSPSSAASVDPPRPAGTRAARAESRPIAPMPVVVDFADVAQQVNPAVVNVEAVSRTRGRSRAAWGDGDSPEDLPDGHPLNHPPREDGQTPKGDSGSGFVVEADGHVLTNYHVIEGAERVTVKLADGRSLRARVVGVDPPTDIALLKVDVDTPLPVAPLGDSDRLRVGEWVCAIGNPLAYEHTVTVGVVSYLGRKLYDPSLDNYIQTDAAINFGNSGGPLINARGEVIGINAAISWRASNIGFAIPINQARSILPQLKARGRVSRGYVGITLRELDPDLRESLGLDRVEGALVQDVAADSPGERAGIRPYDVVVSVDGEPVRDNDDLIRRISERAPGSTVRLDIVRDGRTAPVTVRLTERPWEGAAEDAPAPAGGAPERPAPARPGVATPSVMLGIKVRDIDRALARRLELPSGVHGVLVTAVDPLSAAAESGFAQGDVILEVNRRPVRTMREYLAATAGVRPGAVLLFFCYVPDLDQRVLRTVRVEPWGS